MITWKYSNAKTNWSAVSFAAGKNWISAANRLSRQLKKTGVLNELTIYDEDWLLSQDRRKLDGFRIEEKYPKGFGLWHWKPLVIKAALLQSPKSAGVVYIDAGCEINLNRTSIMRLLQYLRLAETKNGLAFLLDVNDSEYSSPIINEYIPRLGAISEKQISATVLFFPNTSSTHEFLEEWNSWCLHEDYALLKGFLGDESDEFQKHRHDQSILSALWKSKSMEYINDETFWGPNWKVDGINYPIWAARNRSSHSIQIPKLFWIALRIIEKKRHRKSMNN